MREGVEVAESVCKERVYVFRVLLVSISLAAKMCYSS
jgi:hypothetical protein